MERCWSKLLFIGFTFSVSFALSENQYFLKPSEKAIAALALKSIEATDAERSDLIKKIYTLIQKSEHKTQERVRVSSLKNLELELQNENLFSQYNLTELDTNELLAKIKSVEYYSDVPTVQKKIEAYFKNRSAVLASSGIYTGIAGLDFVLQNLKSNQNMKEFAVAYVEKMSEEFIKLMTAQQNPQTLILGKLIKLYFFNLPISQKLEIAYQMSKIPLNSTVMDYFLVMIQNAGPQIQKLVQIMGRSTNIPAEFQEVFQKLESQVKEVPWRVVKALMESEGLNLSDFQYFERKPIGVGTMAQTHRAQMVDKNGQRHSFVIRFLKLGIEKMVEMDYQILKKISRQIDADPELKKYNLPSLVDLVDDLNNTVVEELALARTIKDQNKGQKIYSRSEIIEFNGQKNKLQFNVPQTYAMGKNKKLMAQDLVFGQKPHKELKQYAETYPDLYKTVAEKTAELWLGEAFFKSGFFHADLHQGNLMLQITEEQITVNLLDFGMTGQLTLQLQKSALLLGLGIKTNNPDLIFKHLTLLSKDQTEAEKLRTLITERCLQIQRKEIKTPSLADWVAWSLDRGLKLNYEFLKLNRGLTAIEVLLSDAQSPLTFIELVQKIALKNKIQMTDLLLKEKTLKAKDYSNIFTLIKKNAPQEKALSCQALF